MSSNISFDVFINMDKITHLTSSGVWRSTTVQDIIQAINSRKFCKSIQPDKVLSGLVTSCLIRGDSFRKTVTYKKGFLCATWRFRGGCCRFICIPSLNFLFVLEKWLRDKILKWDLKWVLNSESLGWFEKESVKDRLYFSHVWMCW